jgi:hypothetical protein
MVKTLKKDKTNSSKKQNNLSKKQSKIKNSKVKNKVKLNTNKLVLNKEHNFFIKKFKSKKTIYNKSSENYLDVLVNKIKFTKNHKKIFNKFSKFEKYVLSYYKGTGYQDINNYLYDEKINKFKYPNIEFAATSIKQLCEPEIRDLVDNESNNVKLSEYPEYIKKRMDLIVKFINTIDNIFNKPLIQKIQDNDTILYRGMNLKSDMYKDYKIDDIVHFKNFMSCSLDMQTSTQFTGKCCLYKITNLKDVPYIYLPWSVIHEKNYYTNKYNHVENDRVYDFTEEFEMLLPRGLKFKITNIEKMPLRDRLVIGKISSMKELYKKTDMNKSELKKEITKIMPTIGMVTMEYIGMEQIAVPVYTNSDIITINIDTNRINILKANKLTN